MLITAHDCAFCVAPLPETEPATEPSSSVARAASRVLAEDELTTKSAGQTSNKGSIVNTHVSLPLFTSGSDQRCEVENRTSCHSRRGHGMRRN